MGEEEEEEEEVLLRGDTRLPNGERSELRGPLETVTRDDGRGISVLCLFQPGSGGNQRDHPELPWGYWGPPLHNMGLCSRLGEGANAWKHFGPELDPGMSAFHKYWRFRPTTARPSPQRDRQWKALPPHHTWGESV